MSNITHVSRVLVPVADQDAAIAWYVETLGCTLAADVPFGDGARWVEVALPQGPTAIALVPPQGEYRPGRMTGMALAAADPRAVHAELRTKGVDVDEDVMGGDGSVPVMFFLRDCDGNQLMIVEER